jgi:peroxiredoxin
MRVNLFVLFIIMSFQLIYAQEREVEFPKEMPEFSIFAEDGSVFTDKDLAKNKNIVFIYFNPTCGHCKTAFKTLNINYNSLDIKKLKIYPVSAGTVEETTVFFKELAPNLLELKNIEVIYDEDYRFADAFSVGGFPHTFLYDKDKILVDSYPGEQKVLDPFKALLKE